MKQLFDESKRPIHSKPSSSYVDAKPSYLLQDEMLFDTAKRKEFERNKQKFDRKPHSSSSSRHKFQASKSFEARNDINQRHRSAADDYGLRNNMNINESQQNFDCEASSSKKSAFHLQYLNEKQDNMIDLPGNFNLDGLKVSEDDDDDVSCRNLFS